eukprot:g8678.t1
MDDDELPATGTGNSTANMVRHPGPHEVSRTVTMYAGCGQPRHGDRDQELILSAALAASLTNCDNPADQSLTT